MTPSEALDKINTMFLAYAPRDIREDKELNEDLFECIKTALKDYERRLALAKEYEDVNKVGKRLKALEIIKERPSLSMVDYKYSYEEWLSLFEDEENFENPFKSKEEYNLLKEVLLWERLDLPLP